MSAGESWPERSPGERWPAGRELPALAEEASGFRPRVSVVMPTRNEARGIERTVRSVLAQQEPPGGFELLVVDGRSDAGTREVLERLCFEDPRLRVLDNPDRITAAAFNRGIRAARGEVIVIMGAHNVYAPDYLVESVDALARTGADNVGGAMHTEGRTRLQQAIAAAHHSAFAVGGARWHDPSYEGPADTVFGGAYRREVFERIGGFDEELVRNQDDELNLRLVRSGGRIWQSPRIRSTYTPRDSLGRLWTQYRQYGFWKVRVIQKHRLPASPRHLVPGAFVAALAATAAVALVAGTVAALTGGTVAASVAGLAVAAGAAVAGSYLVAVLAASLLTARRSAWRLLPLLPAVFACYHLAYGIGFLQGVLEFVVLRRGPPAAQAVLSR